MLGFLQPSEIVVDIVRIPVHARPEHYVLQVTSHVAEPPLDGGQFTDQQLTLIEERRQRSGLVPRWFGVSDDEPAFAGCGGETGIEGGYRAVRLLGRQQHAAVRKPQASADSQYREPCGRILTEAHTGHVELTQHSGGTIELPGPCWTDEHFGEREWTRAQGLISDVQQQCTCTFMVSVGSVEVGDEHAGVQHDHAGQSSRNPLR